MDSLTDIYKEWTSVGGKGGGCNMSSEHNHFQIRHFSGGVIHICKETEDEFRVGYECVCKAEKQDILYHTVCNRTLTWGKGYRPMNKGVQGRQCIQCFHIPSKTKEEPKKEETKKEVIVLLCEDEWLVFNDMEELFEHVTEEWGNTPVDIMRAIKGGALKILRGVPITVEPVTKETVVGLREV